MKHKNIISLLNQGNKLVSVTYGVLCIHYYIDDIGVKRKLTEEQFIKYKKMCNKKDEEQKNKGNDIYYCYYWKQ